MASISGRLPVWADIFFCLDDEHSDGAPERRGHIGVYYHADDCRCGGGQHSYVTWQHPQQVPVSRDSVWDQIVCHLWVGRQTLWHFIFVSTYGIIFMTFDRYCAVVYPIWYNGSVSTADLSLMLSLQFFTRSSSATLLNTQQNIDNLTCPSPQLTRHSRCTHLPA